MFYFDQQTTVLISPPLSSPLSSPLLPSIPEPPELLGDQQTKAAAGSGRTVALRVAMRGHDRATES